jgi:Mn-containing catalase
LAPVINDWVALGDDDAAVVEALAVRTASATTDDPTTGVDLGAGAGAGRITGEDKGAAADIDDAVKMADAI